MKDVKEIEANAFFFTSFSWNMTQLQAHRQMEVKEKWAVWCKSGVENNKIQKTQQNLAREGGNKAGL